MAMGQYQGRTIDELIMEMEAAWQRLIDTMTSRKVEAYSTHRDPAGWTALDHMAHVSVWERSVLAPLKGGTRHEALGLTDEQFVHMGFDEQNEIIRAQTEGHTWEQVMAEARQVHEDLIEAVRRSSIEDLWKSTSELCADQREHSQERPFMQVLMSDGCEHFDEHRGYIEKILAS